MKITVILTGGTIACKTENHIMNPQTDSAYSIINMYKSQINGSIEFTAVQPFNILSENYTSKTYNLLLDYLYNLDFSDSDGVIITHGSDTLSYTSALVAMIMPNVKIPVVLTAADYPPDNSLSNALSNFSAAVEFISAKTAGIFTAYGDKGSTNIYLATRLSEADPINDKFSGSKNSIIAKVTNNSISYLNKSLINTLTKGKRQVFTQKPIIKRDILLIKTYPNQNYSFYAPQNAAAVVLYLYHSATACTVGTNTSIIEFIKKCSSASTPVYLASYKNKPDRYATTNEIDKLNAIPLYNITKESAYIKALLAYNQSLLPPNEIMNSDIYFECQ